MQEFSLKTEVFFGENALDHLLDKDSSCAFIVADPFTVKSGLIKLVTDRLEATDVPYLIYDDVVPDPPLAFARTALWQLAAAAQSTLPKR